MMIRYIIVLVVLITSGCQVFHKNDRISKNKINTLKIYAHTKTNIHSVGGIKIKTRATIFKDSIIITGSPLILGIELFKLVLKDDTLILDQKINNKQNTSPLVFRDNSIKLKKIKKSITKKRSYNDTIFYKNKHITGTFTQYIKKNNIFLPQRIIFQTNMELAENQTKGYLDIEYQAVKFSSKKER